jgi:gas vesicle protein
LDWKQIIPGLVTGAILGIAGTFFVLAQKTAKLEVQIEHLQSQINQFSETKKESKIQAACPQNTEVGGRVRGRS